MATIKISDWETPEALELIKGWARDGIIDKDIAYNIGISENTFCRWKKRSPAILGALKEAKEVADRRVENALYKSALGYQYVETVKERDEFGNLVVTREITRDVKPNTTAQIFWLKNRKPEVWQDHPEQSEDPSQNPLLGSLLGLLKTEKGESDG